MYQEEKHVAYCTSTGRVLPNATDAQNAARRTLTLIFLPKKPPEETIPQGNQDFGLKSEIGSLRALSIATRCRLASDSCGLPRHVRPNSWTTTVELRWR